MNRFFRNILRTIAQNKISYIGAVLIIAMGALTYTGMTEFYIVLEEKSMAYFNNTSFADVFVEVTAMPEQKVSMLEDIKGIDESFGRLEGNLRLLRDDEKKIITIHAMAYSPNDKMNKILLEPTPDNIGDTDIFISKKMCDIYGINSGDEITVIANNRTKKLTCKGIAYSSEHMSSTADESAKSPDSSVYDIGVMSKEGLENLLGKKGDITNIGLRLSKGTEYSDVKYSIEQMLKRYNVVSITKKADQDSYYAITDEIDVYKLIVSVIPTVFMAVTVFMLYIVLKKMIDKDRILIGTMKAFGASDIEILTQYMKQAVVIGIIGGVLFLAPAEMMGKFLYVDDANYFNLPDFNYEVHLSSWIMSIVISLATSVISVYLGVRGVVKINPAESMRAAAPKGGSSKIPAFVDKILNIRQKIGLTSMLRNKGRSLIIAVAVAFPFSCITAFGSYNILVDKMVDDQFGKIENYDIKVKLTEFIDRTDAETILRNMKDVSDAEAVASYSTLMTAANHYEYAPLIVLNNNSDMYRIMDRYGNFYEPRDDGIIMSHHLANKLKVKKGDTVKIECGDLTYTNSPVEIPIVGISEDASGTYSYINGAGIERYFPVKDRVNLLLILADEGKDESIKTQISKMRNISLMFTKDDQKASYAEMMSTIVLMMNFIAVFSIIAGVLMIYNIMGISIRERKNEFGTLMVLGMTKREISEIIVFEQLINFCIGILLGIPCIYAWCRIIEFAASSDTETITMQIFPIRIAAAILVCVISTVISVVLIIRDVFNMELTDVLKERE
ncbi:MAG: FtsX-like permease family protein [Firmicutes bacterium]|nr:FtsX-like permease family protein [Bacillota bacterium]